MIACCFSLGECEVLRRFSPCGRARSGSDCISPLRARILMSSSVSPSGETALPEDCFTSTSRALASSSQRLVAHNTRSTPRRHLPYVLAGLLRLDDGAHHRCGAASDVQGPKAPGSGDLVAGGLPGHLQVD